MRSDTNPCAICAELRVNELPDELQATSETAASFLVEWHTHQNHIINIKNKNFFR
jgi:hypothetical protein